MLNNLMRHSYLYTLYNCSVVFWWNWSVFNVLSKTCHITKIFRRSSAKFRYSFAPSAKTLASAEHYKGMFGAPLFQIPRWDTEVRFVTKFGKIGHCKVAKRSRGLPHKNKLALCGTRPSPHFVQNVPIAPKIPWTLSSLFVYNNNNNNNNPLTCPHILNLVQIGCALPDLFRKDWFFGPKSHYNIGFQPTIICQKYLPLIKQCWHGPWVMVTCDVTRSFFR